MAKVKALVFSKKRGMKKNNLWKHNAKEKPHKMRPSVVSESDANKREQAEMLKIAGKAGKFQLS